MNNDIQIHQPAPLPLSLPEGSILYSDLSRKQKARIALHNTKVRSWHNLAWIFLFIGLVIITLGVFTIVPPAVGIMITGVELIAAAIVVAIARVH